MPTFFFSTPGILSHSFPYGNFHWSGCKRLKAELALFSQHPNPHISSAASYKPLSNKMPLKQCLGHPKLGQLSKSSTAAQHLVIPSRSVSCGHKCQASPVSFSIHPLTLCFSTSLSLSKLYKCHFIMHLSSLWVLFHLSPFFVALPSVQIFPFSLPTPLTPLSHHPIPFLYSSSWIPPSLFFAVTESQNWISSRWLLFVSFQSTAVSNSWKKDSSTPK